MKRYAFHEVDHPQHGILRPGVAEIESGKVVRCYRLTAELEQTQWLGGALTIAPDGQAWHNGMPLRD